MFRIVVDGTTHRVTRDDGGVVRAGWPAFVVSVLVAARRPGRRGRPVVVLESMKMESTVTAPYAGEVAAVEVDAQRPGGHGRATPADPGDGGAGRRRRGHRSPWT